jgi:hypothetical protein
LTHYGSWFYHRAGEARRRICGLAEKSRVRVNAGYDCMEVEI